MRRPSGKCSIVRGCKVHKDWAAMRCQGWSSSDAGPARQTPFRQGHYHGCVARPGEGGATAVTTIINRHRDVDVGGGGEREGPRPAHRLRDARARRRLVDDVGRRSGRMRACDGGGGENASRVGTGPFRT
ncbi:hypothetical protein VFPFJ_07772 [Purpureocillium lilacinum]|uniref:Uncharacterized protein n=1 Tax=Purpureocillium lilacinum TaxID=33203 RepID=A0A179H759_PURLI|nr:hypothetical protein VFPFJ_07772 [Purpureocillium lilacinum]OAQ85383.1 hypothetical protein VFPFJ_07772 [Purpureocillium lilacinum]